MLYRHCYIASFQAQAVQIILFNCIQTNVHRNIMKRTTISHWLGGNRKRQYNRQT